MSDAHSNDLFGTRQTLDTGSGTGVLYSLQALRDQGVEGIGRLALVLLFPI